MSGTLAPVKQRRHYHVSFILFHCSGVQGLKNEDTPLDLQTLLQSLLL